MGDGHKKNTDYSVCIKVSEGVYEKWKDRLKLKGIKTYGDGARTMLANRYVYERAVTEITDQQLDRLVEDLIGGTK